MQATSCLSVGQLFCKILSWLNLAKLELAKPTPKLNVPSLL